MTEIYSERPLNLFIKVWDTLGVKSQGCSLMDRKSMEKMKQKISKIKNVIVSE